MPSPPIIWKSLLLIKGKESDNMGNLDFSPNTYFLNLPKHKYTCKK